MAVETEFPGVRHVIFGRMGYDVADRRDVNRLVPIQEPVAPELNGIGYAVIMATPTDLVDFVTGFTISEGLATAPQIVEPSVSRLLGGRIVRTQLPERSMARIVERARTRVPESGCRICGIDSIAAALAPLPSIAARIAVQRVAVARAVSLLRDRQTIGRATGATHAAVFCNPAGGIVLSREDIGRHNALDKLVGALARQGIASGSGFVLPSARCSQERVEKTVWAGFPMLVTLSAATSLAIDRARQSGLALAVLTRELLLTERRLGTGAAVL